MKRYQRIIALFAQAFLVMLVLASCAKDKSLVGTEEIPGGSGDAPRPYGGMLYIRLFTDGGVVTRGDDGDLVADGPEHEHESGDLVNGSDAEHAIGTFGNYVIFFDKEKKYYGISELTLTKDTEFDHGGHQREAIYGARIEATVNENAANDEETEVWPSWCLVVLNGQDIVKVSDDSQTLAGVSLTGKSLDQVLNIAWTYEANSAGTDAGPYTTGANASGFGKNSDGLFVMTNAVYLKGNNEVYAATEIPDNLIQEGGAAIDEDKILFVHVERMLAKFDFSIKPAEGVNNSGDNNEIFQPSITPDIILFDKFMSDGSPHYIAKQWRIAITGWNINALENKSYLFKKINTAGYKDDDEDTSWDSWNEPRNYRSYWAEDVTYKDQRYPWQYRNPGYESAENVPYYSATGTDAAGVTKLMNYSFNALGLGDKSTDHFTRTIYTPESTFDAYVVKSPYNTETRKSNHDNRDELLAATHLLVGAELQIKEDDYEVVDIYRDRSGFFYRTQRESFAVLIHAFNQLLTSQKSMDYSYYTWNKTIKDKIQECTGFRDNGVGTDPRYTPIWSEAKDIENGDKVAAKPASVEDETDASITGLYGGNYDFCLYFIDAGGTYHKLDDAFLMSLVDENKSEDEKEQAFKDMFGGLVLGEIPGGDGQRLPWPAKGRLTICNSAHQPIYIYTSDYVREGRPTVHKGLRQASENDIKSLLYEWVGAIDHFSDGRMYYSHGIDHFPDRVVMAEGVPVTDEEGKENGLTGRFGAVRNNWYRINLTRIRSLGVPVDDPLQPIVPARSTPHDQINVTVSILDWHDEETTTPTVGPNITN